ncbi:MAG: 30S ribosomal protein S7 [Candidatus Omnitrophota bacterium]
MRRRRVPKKPTAPDSKYHSPVLGKFINMIMERGKKAVAEQIVYRSLDTVAEKAGKANAVEIFEKALSNVRPLLEVKSRRVGGATYQVPIEIQAGRGTILAMRWIRDFARARKGRPMHEKLAQEILEAYKGEGQAVKKREDTHRMAEANKAFSHYRW